MGLSLIPNGNNQERRSALRSASLERAQQLRQQAQSPEYADRADRLNKLADGYIALANSIDVKQKAYSVLSAGATIASPGAKNTASTASTAHKQGPITAEMLRRSTYGSFTPHGCNHATGQDKEKPAKVISKTHACTIGQHGVCQTWGGRFIDLSPCGCSCHTAQVIELKPRQKSSENVTKSSPVGGLMTAYCEGV